MNKAKTLTEKILAAHLVRGVPEAGALCFFRVDSVLFHDMSAILAMMGYDAMGAGRAHTELSVIFNDHNLVCADRQTADDRAFVRSCAKAFGMKYFLPGSGICHTLYAEEFARPGMLLIGADSHTASCGALGMLGVGMGGMEVSSAMTGKPFPMRVPRVIRIHVTGRLRPGVSAMDAALQLTGEMTVRGAVNAVLEYTGEGIGTLSVPQRQTLCNLGAEMGATSSVFPADSRVRSWLRAHGREEDFAPLSADEGAEYSQERELDLSRAEPMAALPGRPDRCVPVREAEKMAFSQIFIGSCANGSYESIARVALVLRGQRVSPDTELLIACGSRRVFRQLDRDGYVDMLIAAGARFLESACGPCMGIGQAPASGARILRTTNRNFPGRAGTPDAEIYLSGPETAAASAVTGRLTAAEEIMDPRALEEARAPSEGERGCDMVLDFASCPEKAEPVYTKNIRPIPASSPLPDSLRLTVSLKAGDGISTDDIVPPVPQALTLRANIPALSEFLFCRLDPGFAQRAARLGQSLIAAGEDYAQGSSREHAAAGCLALGVRMVLVKSMHRIHRANLINYGILPALFERPGDYDALREGDVIAVSGLREGILKGAFTLMNETSGARIPCRTDLNEHEARLLMSGGLLRSARGQEETDEPD